MFESLWNNSSGSNHVLNMLGEHENLDQYGPCAIQSERMLCPHSTSSVGIKNVHLCTLASKFSSLTDSTQGFWLVTYFQSYLWTILDMNKLSILLGCQCCEKWSQIIHINLTKTSKISHYTNSYQILNLISKQIFQIKTLKYIFPFITQWILLQMVSRDGP